MCILHLAPRTVNFYWQDACLPAKAGFGIFSVNPTEKDIVIEYIKNQEDHHKTDSFQDEFKAFLKKYNIEYNASYLWD